MVLIDENTYSKFPKSLYMICKLFGISNQIIKYATCKKYCKIYALKDLLINKPYHYTFRDFSNHSMVNLRSPCNSIITKQLLKDNKLTYQPSPIANINQQL